MLVTFRCNSRTLRYKPGNFYTEELTPLLKKVLEQDRQLSLIDPPSLDIEYLKPPKPKLESFKKTYTLEKPVQKNEMENIENVEREEDIQDFSGTGAPGISD